MEEDIKTSTDHAKFLAMGVLSSGSFICGILPAALVCHRQRFYPLLESTLLCFGAGILFCTSLVHILADVRKDVPNDAELYFCGGYFLMYLVDELIFYFFGNSVRRSQVDNHNHVENGPSSGITQYGGTSNETSPLLFNRNAGSTSPSAPALENEDNRKTLSGVHNEYHVQPTREAITTGTFGLLFALTLHSVLEGLAIGVQNTATKTLVLLGAVACHKCVMSFCVGFQIRSNHESSWKHHVVGILVFSLGSALGIGIGLAIVDASSETWKLLIPILQALAGGTLLYVTVCEVLPQEKGKRYGTPFRRYMGLLQFIAVAIGFVTMAVITKFIGD